MTMISQELLRIRALRAAGDHESALRLAQQQAALAVDDAELQFETACLYDYLGREADAVAHYRAAIDAGLEGESLRSAFVGLGSTFRALGRYPEALATFDAGLQAFPQAAELHVFRAMVLHNLGRGKEAVEVLLGIVARTTADPDVASYRRAIELYAEDLDRRWD
jgi:tetratricopeptide (TPR) repeat protein